MTDQILESIIIDGKKYPFDGQPFDPYLEVRDDIIFHSLQTSLYRGYVGTWEIYRDHLYLIEISGDMITNENDGHRLMKPYKDSSNVEYLFSKRSPIMAGWFTGRLRIDLGYEHKNFDTGYCSKLEKERTIEIAHGVVVESHEVDHGTTYRKLDEFELTILRKWS